MARSAFATQLADILLSDRTTTALTLDDIRAAARRIEGRVLRTPLRSSSWLSATAGCRRPPEARDAPSRRPRTRSAAHSTPCCGWSKQHGGDAAAAGHGVGGKSRPRAGVGRSRRRHAAHRLRAASTRREPSSRPFAASGAVLVPCRDYDEAERRAKEHAAREGAAVHLPVQPSGRHRGRRNDRARDPRGLARRRRDRRADRRRRAHLGDRAGGSRRCRRARRCAGVEVEASCPFTRGSRPAESSRSTCSRRSPTGSPATSTPTRSPSTSFAREVCRIAARQRSTSCATPSPASSRTSSWLTEGAGAVGVAAMLAGKLDARRQARGDRALGRQHRSGDAERDLSS